MDIENYYWICPNCGSKVDALKQLVDACFDDDGEASFNVDKDGSIIFHTVFCPECEAKWMIHSSGMILDEVK